MSPETLVKEPEVVEVAEIDDVAVLVEEVSIDGLCGVY
jgi:mycofactocin precursor